MTREGWRIGAHAALVVVGLLLVIYALVGLASPSVTCRGVVMAPGDVCHKSSFTQQATATVQSYEQRVASARQSRPVVGALGVAVGVFGAGLLVQGRRARSRVGAGSV